MKHKKMGVNYGMKKKYFYFVLLGIMLLVIAACVPTSNMAPTQPLNPDPADEATGVSVTPTLSWQASIDPNEDPVTYDLYFGEAQDNLSVKASDLDTNSYEFTDTLNYGTIYYWQVVAKDGKGGQISSPIWSFTTEVVSTNTPPTAPTNLSPANGATGISVTPTLSWQASTDPDEDSVTYDLYLGEAQDDLSVKASDLGTNSYEFEEPLEYGTTYYWQVVAKDGRGGEASSDVWSFTTMGDVINDLNNLTKDDSLYILKIFIDEDINDFMSAIDEYTDENYIDLEELDNVFDIISELETYYQGLLGVYDANSDAIDKLQDMMLASESLIGDMDLHVQIVDQAKDDIIAALGGTEEPETLVVDYRDLLNMRMQVWSLLSLYEMKDPLQPYFDAVDSIEQNGPLDYFLLEESYQLIFDFIAEYENSNKPWETEGFWNDLNSLVTTLAGLTGDTDVLTTDDIFKGDVLSIGGLDFVIEKGKFILESFNDLYYFEEDKTDELGWTDDNAISLYEYPYFAYGEIDAYIKQTEFMGEPIDLISELFSGELSGLIDIIKELTFGNIDLLQETSWIELSEELNYVLPHGVLELTVNIQTPAFIEGSVGAMVSIDASINLDFGALSDGTPLDLMSNNLGMKPAMISGLIEQGIWEILATGNITEEQASAIYNIILSNLIFYDGTNTLTIEMDDSIIAEVVINLEWE